MRVPLPIVFLLALCVTGGAWWWNTRGSDFVTPPSDQKLAAIRTHVEASLPGSALDAEENPIAPTDPAPEPEIVDLPPEESESIPDIQLGDLHSAPSLDAYAELAEKGAAYLIELASLLETEGEFQRSLLAWERVLDHSNPDPLQAAVTLNAIRRLRPTLPDWNIDPTGAFKVVLHGSTGPALSKALSEALEQTSLEVEQISSGIVSVTSSVSTGRTPAAEAPAPVAIWVAGAGSNAPSSEVLSFTVSDPEQLSTQLRGRTYQLIANHLQRSTPSITPPLPLAEGDYPEEMILLGITRLAWEKLGQTLNTPSS